MSEPKKLPQFATKILSETDEHQIKIVNAYLEVIQKSNLEMSDGEMLANAIKMTYSFDMLNYFDCIIESLNEINESIQAIVPNSDN